MPLSEYKAGTATVAGTSEHSLVNNSSSIASDSTHGVYQLFLDLAALGASAVTFSRNATSKRSPAPQQRFVLAVVGGPHNAPLITGAFQLKNGWDLTVRKIAGSDRAIPFSIRKAG